MNLRIVFIHLGEAKAPHLWANIENILRSNHGYEIDVITSKPIKKMKKSHPSLNFSLYGSEMDLSSILDESTIDPTFRNGFWRFSLERLFTLTAHHQKYPSDSLLHIESDVLLLPNFPFQIFKTLAKPAWSKLDIDRDIAAILYIPNLEKSNWLSKVMMQEVQQKKQINDMLLLNTISSKYPESVMILPSSPHQDSALLNNIDGISSEVRHRVSSNFEIFDGIFDPAALGIWLTGNDPRNAFGVTRKFDTRSLLESGTFVDPSKTIFNFSEEEGLYVTDNGKKVRVFNLHIHSKNENLFNSNWRKVLFALVKSSRRSRIKKTFSVRILLHLLYANHKNGTLLRFLLWLPFLAPFKKCLIQFKRYLTGS